MKVKIRRVVNRFEATPAELAALCLTRSLGAGQRLQQQSSWGEKESGLT